MTRTPAQRRRRLAAGLVPLLVALGALPLMAPTCGSPGEGSKIFAQGSLIIPMDVCYQYQTDWVRGSYAPTACPQAVDGGNVIRAYGLVYELIRHGIAVYWIIENTKTAVDGVDFNVEYHGGPPVLLYDWASDGAGGAPTAQPIIHYRGGPFVVDGSDAARARAVMQQFRGTFQGVNVHVSNVAFKGYAKRTMAGGWSAGGTVPPKLALLDIGSSGAGAKNSEYVIRGYLTQAGLDTPGAANDPVTGAHGEIFDRLLMADFINTTTRNWQDTNLHRNGYQILWVPHWAAPSSCSDCAAGASCSCNVKYSEDEINLALKTIEEFVKAGGDLFAECAGLGSFEGVFRSSTSTSSYSPTYVTTTWRLENPTGTSLPDFQTVSPTGVWINKSVGSAYLWPGYFNSPFMQLGDYPFIPQSGAIQNYKAASYQDPTGVNSTVRLISDSSDHAYDIFTLRPRPPSGARGTIVYLGGHSYSGNDGDFEIAGTRLVLNTLFNLGAGCTADGVACNTGLFGVCAVGHYHCNAVTGQPDCIPDTQPDPSRRETCNGLDDNCNGEIDEDLTNPDCFEPPAGWVDPDGRTTTALFVQRNVGVCKAGVSTCSQQPDGTWAMSACVGQVLPQGETCNGLDDDCDGTIDGAMLTTTCYDGPADTLNVGECKGGARTCVNGAWGADLGSGFVPGACSGEVLPVGENCGGDGRGNGMDDNCNRAIDEGCTCAHGTSQPCFTGPGTPGVGTCTMGTQLCDGGIWGECNSVNADLVNPEPCTTPAKPGTDPGYVARLDTNCDGRTTQCTECNDTDAPQSCWGPSYDPAHVPTAAGRGQCTWGARVCRNGTWGAYDGAGSFVVGGCAGYGLQSVGADGAPVEYCDHADNNCNGPRVASPDGRVPSDGAIFDPYLDDSAICPARYTCLNGVCVPAVCGSELPAPEGYTCNTGTHTLVQSTCGGATCGAGELCQYSTCVDPCPVSSTEIDPETLRSASLVCGAGTSCGGGACIGGGCYETGCGAGEVCLQGSCAPDACAGVTCPSGTFCREGFCYQACAFVSCYEGQRCGPDGFCVADACASVACAAGLRCANGLCVADPCVDKGCATGQYCDASTGHAICVDDPCAAIDCPVGVCVRGQCYASGNPTGAGTASVSTSTSKKGCGCTAGTEAAWPALLGLLLAPLRRRRSGGRGGLALLLLAAAAVAVAPGCKKSSTKSEFDPSLCVETCGEQRCVDVTKDPGHCGVRSDPNACTHACGSGEQCVDGTCGPSDLVAPYVASLSPATAPKDAPSFALTVAGERLKAGATVRVKTNLGDRTIPCPATAGGDCQWLSASALAVHLDLSGATETPWTVRVVNPDQVISNARSLEVHVPVPSVTSVSPQSIVAGTTATITIVGTGFTRSSTAQLSGGSLGSPLGLSSCTLGAVGLDCVLNASGLLSGSYTVKVISEKGVASQSWAALTITPSDPVVFSVSPESASAGVAIALTITGDRFDTTSRVLLDGVQLPAFTFYSGSVVGTSLNTSSYSTGTHSISVRNGTGASAKTSNAVAFTIGALPIAISGFTPGIVYQGDDAVTLTFMGSNFDPSYTFTVEVQPPGTTVFTGLPTTVNTSSNPNTATATYSFIGGAEGSWLARLRYGNGTTDVTTAPWPMRVLSNQAILRDYWSSPAPEQAGMVGASKDSVTFDVANLRPPYSGLRVLFDSVTASSTIHWTIDPPDPEITTSRVVLGTFSLGGLEAGTYQFTIQNPNGASPSNALTFAVTPGTPTLTSVCLDGTSCTQQAAQASTPLTIRLRGTNFARKDANGNGSTVMIASAYSPNWPAGDPCGVSTTTSTQFGPAPITSMTVVSSTEMVIQVDSRAAYPDPSYGTTYYVGIWNPGGTSGPLKSSCKAACTVPASCPYATAPAIEALPWFRITAQ